MADNDDIPFNRDFPLKPGVVEEACPGVRRILCNNPSPFTFTGTVSYIVGKGNVAIIDPGPDDEAPIRTYDLLRSKGVHDRRTGLVDGDVKRVLGGRVGEFLEAWVDDLRPA